MNGQAADPLDFEDFFSVYLYIFIAKCEQTVLHNKCIKTKLNKSNGILFSLCLIEPLAENITYIHQKKKKKQ
jgi:hypothetical protein